MLVSDILMAILTEVRELRVAITEAAQGFSQMGSFFGGMQR